ncbi:hypothetical protein Glove_242g90 [Diversispora epigaea]|uniref:Peroxisomal ATPase PEX6 n=1 Tax=Diversispora epigaea TaxID=1348612 RepID=A0A397I9N8_9GLOM|nr:hypothetical protein Glove_242g90 [Diversispora epigaea]
METTTSFTPSTPSTPFTSSMSFIPSTSTLFTFSTPRVARIQFYDYLYTRNLKSDYRIGLSENLWKELIRESDNDDENQTILKSSICVAITPIYSSRKNPLPKYDEKSSNLPIFSTTISYGKYDRAPQDNICYVSQDFAKQNNLYNGATVEVNNANPVELDEVILGTLTYESYELSLRDPITISKYFQNSSSTPIIIRQGQTYSLQNLSFTTTTTTEDDISSFDFKVLMCNPVLQGIITDQTDFIITDISEDALYDIYYDDQYNLESNNLDDQNELLDQNILDLKDDDGLNFLLANLDVVILGTLTYESYELSLRDPITISKYFQNSSSTPIIIRQGQTYSLQNLSFTTTTTTEDDISSFDFKVLMCNPVLQGIITDQTDFIITDISEDALYDIYYDDQYNLESNNLDDQNELLDQNILDLKDDDGLNFLLANLDVGEQDQLIEEEFERNASVTYSSSDDDDDGDNDDENSNNENGDNNNNNELPAPLKHSFFPIALTYPFPTNILQPIPNEKEDSESRVLVSLKELAKLGLQSGSWVLVSGSKIEKTRMCRIYAVDVPSLIDLPLPPVYISPVLYFNLGLGNSCFNNNINNNNNGNDNNNDNSGSNNNNNNNEELYIQPIMRAQFPPPIAKSISVSRIASPHSTDRNIYNASINGLKKWFEDAKRIVCEGDIIPIPIDEEAARLKPQRSEGDIEEIENIHISTKPIKLNIVVYFKVSKMNLKNKKKCMIYGYGRQVDSKKTRLMQTGLEHSKVPVLKLYFNIVTETPSFSHINPILTAPETPFTKLFELISSCLHPNATALNLSCTVLLHGSRGCGKKTIVEWVAERVGVHVYEVNCFEFSGETDSKTESSLRAKIDKAVTFSPCIFLLRHIDALARKSVALETGQEPSISSVLQDSFKQLLENFQTIGYPVLVIGTTGDIEKVPASVISCFRHEISFEAPDEPTRLAILEHLTREIPIAPDVSLSSLATQTAALVAKDLLDLVARAGFVAHERVKKSLIETNKSLKDSDLVYAGIALTADDFNEALTKARSSYSDSIGAPKIPNVTWDDVGGLASIKDDILDTIQLPLEHPELFATGMKKRSGILLYGPPGTGKTLLAKAVATSCSLNFFSVKGPELLNMYIGESEANVRRVFQRARDAKPCVIFFDELDSVAPKRGEKGDSGGVMDRIVSQLLAELDGMGQGGGAADVFVIGATNRPDLLDPALLRPGRFDKLLYLGVSEDHDTQLNIIQALTRKFRLHPSLDLRSVAEKCQLNYTGADFYALCSDAVLKAMSRTAEKVEAKVVQLNLNPKPNLPQPVTSQYYLNHLASLEDTLVEVTQEDFEKALRELVPSVSEKELEYYRTVQMRFTQQVESKQQEMNKEESNVIINQPPPQLHPPLEYNEQINIGVGGSSSYSYINNNNINNNGTIEFEESPYVIDSIKKGKGKDRAE